MSKPAALWCACLVLAACASPQPKDRNATLYAAFPIAGGQTITLPFTDAGAIPAENDRVKILTAGFGIGPSKQNKKQAELFWGFDFEAKSSLEKLETVAVEEVSPSKTAVSFIQDTAPVLKNGVWSGTAKPIPANRASIPWLYTNDGSIYVFRFTIKPEGEAAFVLYQLAWFSAPAKQTLQQLIEHIEHA